MAILFVNLYISDTIHDNTGPLETINKHNKKGSFYFILNSILVPILILLHLSTIDLKYLKMSIFILL